jgi:tetratricopeptide (TPR) repeat protein
MLPAGIFVIILGLFFNGFVNASNQNLYLNFIIIEIIPLLVFVVIISLHLVSKELQIAKQTDRDSIIIGKAFSTLTRKTKTFNSGLKEFQSGRFNMALFKFQEAEQMKLSEKECAVLYFYIAECYYLMNYNPNAAKYYMMSIENNIKHDFVYDSAANCYVLMGCYAEAVEVYNKLLEKGSDYKYLYSGLGVCYLKWERSLEAIESFQKSIELGYHYAFSLGGCALAYLQMKNIEKSMEYYSKAILNNMSDKDGFKEYYCTIAESVGILDIIDPAMKNYKEENSPDTQD